MNSLKTSNIAHLKDILNYYNNAAPEKAKTLWASVDAYVAYCGKNGKADMELWKAIKTNDVNLEFDFGEFSDIRSLYLK